MGQPQLTRFRTVRVTTPVASPVDSPSTSPQITLSPLAPSSQPTTGFLVMLKLPTGSSAVGPFTITPWVRDPVTGLWGSGTTTTGASLGALYSCFDIDASEMYFAITATVDGTLWIQVSEQ